MIDPNKPVRFINGHGRVRIVGTPGTDFNLRYHDGEQWQTGRVDKNGRPLGSRAPAPIENYEIDWDAPLAFIDTGDRGWLSHHTEGDDPIFFVTGSGEERYLYNTVGMALKRDGDFEITARDIMNVETNSTRQRDAQARVDAKREARRREQEALEANPLFGLF